MAQESILPQKLMTAALLHFEQGVPIDDCDIRSENKERLARVSHVYWQWIKNPFLDPAALLRQLTRGKFCDQRHDLQAAARDRLLFDFVKDHIAVGNRHEDELMVRTAAKQAIRIGLETDNPNALTKGGKLLYEVAGLDKPESDKADMSKIAFLQPVVVTDIKEVDDTKENVDDEESKRIVAKYGGYVDEKRKMIEDKVAVMESRSEIDDEQDRNQP